MIQIQFYGLLRMLLKQDRLELAAAEGETIDQLLTRAQQQLSPPFLHKLVDEDGRLRPGTVILVNRHNIHHLDGLKTPVRDLDVIAMFPPGAGG